MRTRTPSTPAHPTPRRRLRRAGAVLAVVTTVVLTTLATGGVAHADPSGVLDQQNTVTTDGYGTGLPTWAQTFTPTLSGPVTGIDLYSGYGRAGTISVTIQTVNGSGVPTGTVIGSGSAAVPASVGWFPVTIDSSAPVTAGTKYAIAFTSANALGLTVSNDDYPGGQLWLSSNGTYQSYSVYDLAFREYVLTTPTLTGTPTTNVPVDHPYSYQYAAGNGGVTTVTAGALPPGITLSEDGALSGTPTTVGSYSFTVTATNSQGTATLSSTIVVRPAEAPTAPQNASATAGAGQAVVSWSAPQDAGDDPVDSFTVTTTPGGATVTTPGVTATVPDLTPGTAYSFTVTAHSASGTSAAASAGPVTPYTTPGAPTTVSTTSGDGSATVQWAPPTTDGYSPVTGYVVDERQADGSWTTVATPGADDRSATIDGLQNGTAYAFRVSAVNAAGTGPAASPDAATPFGVAPSPVDLTATAGNAAVDLAWSAPASDNGSAITGYRIQSSTDGTTWTDAGTSTGTDRTATVDGLVNGTAYSFRVAAENAAGTGAWSAVATATPVTTATAPTHVSVVPGDRTIAVSWEVPAQDGGSPITSYAVEYRTGSGSWSTVTTADAATTSATIADLTNGTAVEVRVRAVTAIGTGAASDTVTTTPFTFDPATLTDAGSTLAGKTLEVGDHVHIVASGLPADSVVTVQLHSTVVTLKTVTIPSTGQLDTDVVIPADTAAGAHELTLTLSGTGADPVTVSTPFTITTPTPAAVVRAGVEQAALAFTGGTISPVAVGGALAAVLAGALLLIVVRRRRRA